jgi:hypothetical protein
MNVLRQIQAMDRKFLRGQQNRGCKKLIAPMVFCLLLALLGASCRPEPGQEASARDQGIQQNYTQDPFTLTQRLNKKEITIAGQLEVVLETAVPENTAVEFPAYSAGLGDFTLKDTRIAPTRMTGSGDTVRVVHQVTYLLEPYLPGTYTIPAMAVAYRNRQNEADVAKLVTEEIQIPVQSLLGPDAAAVEIKDIRPPLSLPPDRVKQALAVGLVLFLAILAISAFFYWKHKAGKNLPPAVQPRPEEIALQELDRLLAEDLLAGGDIKLFHLRISDILRHYIENRFGLQAPERTTEEFLLELSRTGSSENSLVGSHKALLADFLTQCDLVKFARHKPTMAECEKTVVICREFIGKTKEKVIGKR